MRTEIAKEIEIEINNLIKKCDYTKDIYFVEDFLKLKIIYLHDILVSLKKDYLPKLIDFCAKADEAEKSIEKEKYKHYASNI
jgi:hypothetical protein